MNKNNQKLDLLREEVLKRGTDIAPDYPSYLSMAFALATELGEEGRDMFHDLCRPSAKYDREDAEKTFTSAVEKGRGDVKLGTVFFMAKRWGIDVEEIYRQRQKEQRQSAALARQADGRSGPSLQGEEEGEDAEALEEQLPSFDDYQWPWPLHELLKKGQNAPQRDVLLLSSLAALGATVADKVSCLYGEKLHYPCLQLFIVAPPASGKGAMAFVRYLLEPFHREIRERYAAEMTEYRNAMAMASRKGNEERELPMEPQNRMFIISGNNTGTGILQNLMDSDGRGVIFETEADTVSSAIKGDYGHWSDTLRKAWDHDPLSYNRRTNNEYREVQESRLTVVLSGTPGQLVPLIPSAENGLFSRQLFYYMPGSMEWRDQWCEPEDDPAQQLFQRIGAEWKERVDSWKIYLKPRLKLTPEQKEEFNQFFSHMLRENHLTSDELHGTVLRLGVNCVRIMEVVAILRASEGGDLKYEWLLKQPGVETPEGLLPITDSDFRAVLSMMQVLYRHALHVLKYMPQPQTALRPLQSPLQAQLFKALPQEFERSLLTEKGREQGIKDNTVRSWYSRWKRRHLVQETADGKVLKVE